MTRRWDQHDDEPPSKWLVALTILCVTIIVVWAIWPWMT